MKERKHRENQVEMYLADSVQNYETIKYFNNEEIEKERFKGRVDKLTDVLGSQMYTLGKLNQG